MIIGSKLLAWQQSRSSKNPRPLLFTGPLGKKTKNKTLFMRKSVRSRRVDGAFYQHLSRAKRIDGDSRDASGEDSAGFTLLGEEKKKRKKKDVSETRV